MSRDDIAYYKQRAEIERKRAAESADPAVAITHSRLAWEYDKRVRGDVMPRSLTA
ncbi:MAG: hypothetical protein JWR80_774 [Bradyrhizobium sp.]|jgi:hypothetical protein|nr:hypothetical protein [Bradyrhizobium sp.]